MNIYKFKIKKNNFNQKFHLKFTIIIKLLRSPKNIMLKISRNPKVIVTKKINLIRDFKHSNRIINF